MTEKKILIHKKIVTVAWGDMDALGHVNNARYFDYFQEARIDWLAENNFHLSSNTGPVIVHTSCTFLKPVIYPAKLILTSSVHSLGHSSFVIDHDLTQDETIMAQGTSKVVWVDYQQNKSIAIPPTLRSLLTTDLLHQNKMLPNIK